MVQRVFKKYLFLISIVVYLFPLHACSIQGDRLRDVENWFILLDYDQGEELPLTVINTVGMAVLDADSHPPLEMFLPKTVLIAYVSFGEAEDYREYWQDIKEREWILEENPDWEGNFPVDVRNPEWKEIVVSQVRSAIEKGFDGIMMDTLDTAEMLKSMDMDKYAGVQKAMRELVIEVRNNFPDMIMISNNGLSILHGIVGSLDALIVEDVNMMIDFENGGYKRTSKEERSHKVTLINMALSKRPIPVFNIDYTYALNIKNVNWCKEESKKLGYRPYVAESRLDRVYDTIKKKE
jgi:uncharacterized protein (TIGR01370 family)